MKSKAAKTEPAVVLAGLLVFAMLGNWASAYAFGYPFLYCWSQPWLQDLYLDFGHLLLIGALAVGGVMILSGRTKNGLIALAVLVAVIEVPKLADYIFRWGGSCG